MESKGTDDGVLARRAAAGDQSAMAALFARYADPLFALVCHYLEGSRSDAEEIWQETWLAALHSLSGYRGQSGFFTWLGGIARRKVADHYRRRGRGCTELLSETPAQPWAHLLDDGPLPEEIVLQRATRTRVVEALAALPDEYRTALMARYVDECSVEEVARLIGKGYKATESILARARAALRAALEELTEEQNRGP